MAWARCPCNPTERTRARTSAPTTPKKPRSFTVLPLPFLPQLRQEHLACPCRAGAGALLTLAAGLALERPHHPARSVLATLQGVRLVDRDERTGAVWVTRNQAPGLGHGEPRPLKRGALAADVGSPRRTPLCVDPDLLNALILERVEHALGVGGYQLRARDHPRPLPAQPLDLDRELPGDLLRSLALDQPI